MHRPATGTAANWKEVALRASVYGGVIALLVGIGWLVSPGLALLLFLVGLGLFIRAFIWE